MLLNQLSKVIGKAHAENKKYSVLFDGMKKFSIHESDVNPWLVSKYGSYLAYLCCFGNYFSSKTANSSTNNRCSEGYVNLFIGDGNSIFNTSTFSTNTNTSESYRNNFELYIQYYQLLEKYPPNTVNRYFFQLMVDVYSSGIVNDILSNPVNNQDSPSVSFNTPRIKYTCGKSMTELSA
ncbi:hypothetical protein BB559_002378 [Furculomyces boomerangus]|uniref:Uncharacterized protein n=2 Tax=Harpellales TaxID=61421 RepID=A0A2T9YVV0_9FUNG|nr:hypothetical protein BB559_002378 [Furculomyces boomerangus]PVZ97870.1 hypothetical protein BB558_006155 [Smittium angustum]